MSGSQGQAQFESWVVKAATEWGLDGQVVGTYLAHLASAPDETPAERRHAITDVLSGMLENNVDKHVDEIMDKWNFYNPTRDGGESSTSLNVEDRLVKLLGSQTLIAAAPKQYTDDEKKIREAILKQYSQLSEDEEERNGSEGEGSSDLVRNTNVSAVLAAARERRELAKQESQRKKEKDKEDREKQKQLKEEKKEKRKTQKGERKR